MKKLLVLLLLILSVVPSPLILAQAHVEGQLDAGDNNLSQGLYLQFSGFGDYERQYWGVHAGYQLGLVQPQDVFFNSWYIGSFGKLPLGKINLDLGAAYIWTAFAPDLREINWVVYTAVNLDHWPLVLGINRRIYRLSRQAADNNTSEDPESSFIEEWNLMYSAGYRLKPKDNYWNLTFTVTDFDRFLIQQETNPMVNVRFDYRLNRTVILYSELWYKSAGLLNIKLNYFGTSFRLGAIWEL